MIGPKFNICLCCKQPITHPNHTKRKVYHRECARYIHTLKTRMLSRYKCRIKRLKKELELLFRDL